MSSLSGRWGEIAAFAAVAAAAFYLIARSFFRKNKKTGSCCGTGCDKIPKK